MAQQIICGKVYLFNFPKLNKFKDYELKKLVKGCLNNKKPKNVDIGVFGRLSYFLRHLKEDGIIETKN